VRKVSPQCDKKTVVRKVKPIFLSDVSSIFTFFGSGIATSVLFGLLEYNVKARNKFHLSLI